MRPQLSCVVLQATAKAANAQKYVYMTVNGLGRGRKQNLTGGGREHGCTASLATINCPVFRCLETLSVVSCARIFGAFQNGIVAERMRNDVDLIQPSKAISTDAPQLRLLMHFRLFSVSSGIVDVVRISNSFQCVTSHFVTSVAALSSHHCARPVLSDSAAQGGAVQRSVANCSHDAMHVNRQMLQFAIRRD